LLIENSSIVDLFGNSQDDTVLATQIF
jgi:hypothetical protein